MLLKNLITCKHIRKVEIKTKYISIDECLTKCRDIKKKTYMGSSFSKKISGLTNYEEKQFELSSLSIIYHNYIFKGKVVEKADGIYMCGEIIPRPFEKRVWGIIFKVTIFVVLIAVLIDQYSNLDQLLDLITSMLLGYSFIVIFSYLFFKSDTKQFLNSIKKRVGEN